MIKAIFHTPESSFELCKQLGFTHINLAIWTYANEQEVYRAWDKAHNLGLHVILSGYFFYEDSDRKFSLLFGKEKLKCSECLTYLLDEPNLNKISPAIIKQVNEEAKKYERKTICVLSWIRSYRGYENCADYIGFNYYKDLTFLRKLNLWARIKAFQIRNRSPLVAAPPIKLGKILSHFDFWHKWIKPKGGFYWYQFYPNQENPPWHNKDFSEDFELQTVLAKVNMEMR